MSGMRLPDTMVERQEEVLTEAALAFVADLQRTFNPRREELLARRAERQRRIDAGEEPGFLPETRHVREGEWRVAPTPPALDVRKVEITGPVDRKMMINALNSGASVFMADFEDANAPTWENVVGGQVNLLDAVRGTISYSGPDGRTYRLQERTATLMVRPRGWHLLEKHAALDGEPLSASLFDVGLFLFHNGRALAERGAGPFLYLPKLQSHLEARLWDEVLTHAESALGLPHGTIKATVLIEHVLAAFEMDEILYELRDHAAGLNAGRWDYIFSLIKTLRSRPDVVLPDRAQVTMTVPFMRAYTELLVKTCHRRGAHAIGGMAAFIPSRRDPAVNEVALAKVREDKLREVGDGFDGTWVAHPDLVPVAMAVFDEALGARPNQRERLREDVRVTAADLLAVDVPGGRITREGLTNNVSVALQYIESWLRGVGAAAIYNLMEDAATAEIARSQVWQWVYHRAQLADGTPVTAELVRALLAEEVLRLKRERGQEGRFDEAAALFAEAALSETFVEFLTLPAYEVLLKGGQ